MNLLELKLKKSKQVIDEAFSKFEKVATIWDTGKDSTLLLFLTRQTDGNIPVLFSDTTQHFKETYEFRDSLAAKWNLNLINVIPSVSYDEVKEDPKRCCRSLRTLPMAKKIRELGLDAVFVGKRWVEHPKRAQENYFSKRANCYQVHPILHWTEKDVSNFLGSHKISHNALFDKGYERVVCEPCAEPASSKLPERPESQKDKEEVMRRLEALGYW